ncbi:hypothetical protein Syun_003767 [Stephania yunnanensis]|uniref:Uncharacterized protein n=1 Tax=Stephania yunnanensis TaxID=152371 RepID=A0AAP0Q0V8_9MAGN
MVSSRAVTDRYAGDVAWLGDVSGDVAVPGLPQNLGPSQLDFRKHSFFHHHLHH